MLEYNNTIVVTFFHSLSHGRSYKYPGMPREPVHNFFSYSLPIFIIYIRLLNSNLDIRIKLKSIQSRVKYVSGTPLFCFSFVTVFSVSR